MIDKLAVKVEALGKLTGNSEWCYSPEGEDVDNSDFYIQNVIYPDNYDGLKPTQEEVEAKANELWGGFAARQYQRDRAIDYPPIEEQLDMIYHAGLGGDEFQATIKAVKDAHPKE